MPRRVLELVTRCLVVGELGWWLALHKNLSRDGFGFIVCLCCSGQLRSYIYYMMMTPAGGILSLCIRPLSETRPHDSSLVLDVEEGRNPNSCLVSFVAWWWRSSRRVPVRVDSLWSLSTTTHNATDLN